MNDELFMRRCIELARNGAGSVSPNPMVGAVLVYQGNIIGEAWHQRWGEAHAEVNCLRAVSPANQAHIPHATLFCNLEPCSHHGKTPPCTDLILREKIPKVVISNADPNPLVAGKGLAKLRMANVEVHTGILEEEGQWLNRAFFTWIGKKKPWVILKWAQSADGFLGKTGERTAISSPAALRLVHRWRSECDAILVGKNTALLDNPRLDTRLYFGKKPLRVVFDTQGEIPPAHHLLDDSAPTWVYGRPRQHEFGKPLGPEQSAQTKFIDAGQKVLIPNFLEDLREDNRAILLVEGGANLLNQFLSGRHWDEIRVIVNDRRLGGGVVAPKVPPEASLREQFQMGADKVGIFARPFSPQCEPLS